MTTVADIKAKAAEMELAGVDFLDRRGGIAPSWETTKTVRYKFIDGVEMDLPAKKARQLDDFMFKLRPARNDA